MVEECLKRGGTSPIGLGGFLIFGILSPEKVEIMVDKGNTIGQASYRIELNI